MSGPTRVGDVPFEADVVALRRGKGREIVGAFDELRRRKEELEVQLSWYVGGAVTP